MQMLLQFRTQATVFFMQLCDSSTGRLFRSGFLSESEKYGMKGAEEWLQLHCRRERARDAL
jgi:hypothetical protein